MGQLPGVAQAAIVAENEGALVAYLELDDTRDASGAVTGSQALKRIEVKGRKFVEFFQGFSVERSGSPKKSETRLSDVYECVCVVESLDTG